jgi:hypothetical protein
MNIYQIHAYISGKGEVGLLIAPSPEEAKGLMNGGADDEFGTQSFKMGGAILAPFANRIRSKLSADVKTIATNINDKTMLLTAKGERGIALAEAFYAASRSGDTDALRGMLAADVSVHADAGGKRPAATEPVLGLDAVIKLHEYLAKWFRNNESKFVRAGFVIGLPGFITLEADGELQTTAFEIEDGKIAAIYVVRNPDKLRHLH